MKATILLSPDFIVNENPRKPTKLETGLFQKEKKYSTNIAEKIWSPIKYLKLMGYLIASKHDKNNVDNERIFYYKIFSLDSLWAISIQIFQIYAYSKLSDE